MGNVPQAHSYHDYRDAAQGLNNGAGMVSIPVILGSNYNERHAEEFTVFTNALEKNRTCTQLW